MLDRPFMSEGRGRYLVTGGAGFIGSHLCDALLDAGHTVVVLDNLSTGRRQNLDPRVALQQAAITDAAALRQAADGVDGIFHLAAIASVARCHEDWPGTHRINQGGSVMVLDAARTASRLGGPVPVVYASSAAVYGDTGDLAAAESLAPAPQTAYGADKLGSELHARVAALIHGVPTMGLRFFNVYGPRQDAHSPYSGVISIFTQRLARRENIILHGDGAQTRDFVHVTDAVAHLLTAMQRLSEGQTLPPVLNVCTGHSVAIRSVAELIARLLGVSLTIATGPARAGDIRHSRGCPQTSAQALQLNTLISLEQGLLPNTEQRKEALLF